MSQLNQNQVIVRDLIEAVAGATNVALQAAGFAQTVYFMDGHPREIVARLQAKLKHDTQKLERFPLIMLFHDIPVVRTSNVYWGDVTLNMGIANLTKPEYNTPERYDHNIRPVLDPIYYEFLKQLGLSGKFVNAMAKVDHTRFDRVFWGKTGLYGNEGNQFNDYLDCIEINGAKLTIKNPICKPQNF